jgi:cytochrome P450
VIQVDAIRLLAGVRRLPRPVTAALGAGLRHLPSANARVLAFLTSSGGGPDRWGQYRWLRRRAPVLRVAGGMWVVTGHRAAAAVVRHRSASVDDRNAPAIAPYHGDSPVVRLLDNTMLLSDPPAHDRRRHPVARAFTPAKMAALEAQVADLAARRLDGLAPRRVADLLADFAYPFTVDVICEVLGVPADDRWRFPAWAAALARVLDAVPDGAALNAADRAAGQIRDYLRAQLDAFSPDQPGLLGHLAATRRSGELSDDEAVANAALLLVAGHETTANLIANGLHALLTHPDQWALFRSGRADATGAVEELLRYCGPVQLVSRVAVEPLSVEGVEIPAGAPVGVVLAAANRDPEAFTDPDGLLLDRDPNPHLAFSSGIHSCLGAHLARLETRCALTELGRRLPGLRLAGVPSPRDTLTIMGYQALPVSWS